MPRATDNRDQMRVRLARTLEAAALFVLLMVVAMRPLISETYSNAIPGNVAAAGDVGALTPVTTAVFDLLVWLAMGTVLLAAWLDRRRWCWSGIEIAWLLLLLGAIVSTLAASNRRLAINASCDWLTAGVLVFALVNLCRSRLRIALVLAVVIAGGLTAAARCAMQVTVEHCEDIEFYQANREEYWKRQNVPLDDPRVTLHERRMYANEARGFIPFSNAQGAHLALTGFAALAAMTLSGLPVVARRTLFGATGALLLASILMTGSMGAILAAGVGLALWIMLQFTQDRWRRRWRIALGAGWTIVLLATSVTVAWGFSRGTLPGDSLAFRWNYWTVTRDVIAHAPLTGVGALNFDRAYLRHKPIEYPEEIKDPHNFVLGVVSQWGAFGAAGLIAAFVIAPITAARRLSTDEDRAIIRNSNDVTKLQRKYWISWLAVGFVVLRLLMMHSYFGSEGGDALVFFDIVVYAGGWILAMATMVHAMGAGRAADPCFATALVVAVAAFLLHNTIEFALFVPSTLYPFAALVGLLLVRREARGTESRPWVAPCLMKLCWVAEGIGLIAVIAFVLAPTCLVNHHLARGRRTGDMNAYERAVDSDRLDSAAAIEAARAVLFLEPDPLRATAASAEYLAEALRRDPLSIDARRRQVDTQILRYDLTDNAVELEAALSAAEAAVRLYPASPDDHAVLGDVLARLATARHSVQHARQALEQYQTAMKLDGVRRRMGELRQWPETRIHQLKNASDAMHAFIRARAAT